MFQETQTPSSAPSSRIQPSHKGMAPDHHWTEAQDALLKKIFGTTNLADRKEAFRLHMPKLKPHTKRAAASRAVRMGWAVPLYRQRMYWTQAQDDYLEANAQQTRLMQAEEERRQQLIEESPMRRVEAEKANEPEKATEYPAIDRSDDTWSAFGVLGGEVTEFDVVPPRKQDNSYEAYNASIQACAPAAGTVDDFMKIRGIDSDKVRRLLEDFVAYYEAARF